MAEEQVESKIVKLTTRTELKQFIKYNLNYERIYNSTFINT